MKIRGIKIEQGIKIKAVGLSKEERKIITDAIKKIEYGRRKNARQTLPYWMKLK